jgi:D-lactate dehydrogenase
MVKSRGYLVTAMQNAAMKMKKMTPKKRATSVPSVVWTQKRVAIGPDGDAGENLDTVADGKPGTLALHVKQGKRKRDSWNAQRHGQNDRNDGAQSIAQAAAETPKAAALLVEIGAENTDSLEATQRQVIALASAARLIKPVEFTSVTEAIELAWHVREGLLGLIGKNRAEGSTLITEDVCFLPERLAEGARDVQDLLSKHGFIPGVAGRAAHGNLHFTLVANLGEADGLSRYSAFMTELVDLVVGKHDGSLKAEHGTGLNMAPFVASEWGEKATAMMWRIKQLADPHGILAPDVILTRNPKLHLENLKSFPQIGGITGSSQCIECGYCEPVCPSRNVTMTPRQRIALRREMARQNVDSPMLAQLQREYEYDGIETSAGDGMCSIPCPIGINTGTLIKELRARENSPAAEAVALRLAQHWRAVERSAEVRCTRCMSLCLRLRNFSKPISVVIRVTI